MLRLPADTDPAKMHPTGTIWSYQESKGKALRKNTISAICQALGHFRYKPLAAVFSCSDPRSEHHPHWLHLPLQVRSSWSLEKWNLFILRWTSLISEFLKAVQLHSLKFASQCACRNTLISLLNTDFFCCCVSTFLLHKTSNQPPLFRICRI